MYFSYYIQGNLPLSYPFTTLNGDIKQVKVNCLIKIAERTIS